VEEALERVGEEEVFVIGGARIFKQFLPRATRLYITIIDQEFPGDVLFPEIDETVWVEVERVEGTTNRENPYTYFFLVYERR